LPLVFIQGCPESGGYKRALCSAARSAQRTPSVITCPLLAPIRDLKTTMGMIAPEPSNTIGHLFGRPLPEPLVRQLLDRHISRDLIDREKTGFSNIE
jgi:hypothetical protein